MSSRFPAGSRNKFIRANSVQCRLLDPKLANSLDQSAIKDYSVDLFQACPSVPIPVRSVVDLLAVVQSEVVEFLWVRTDSEAIHSERHLWVVLLEAWELILLVWTILFFMVSKVPTEDTSVGPSVDPSVVPSADPSADPLEMACLR